MKKALSVLLLLSLLLSCLLLSGCHGTLVDPDAAPSPAEAAPEENAPEEGEETGESLAPVDENAFVPPASFDESRKITITFWAKNDSNKTQVAIYKKAIEDFEKLYPNVTVNLRLYTDYGKIYNDVITNVATRTTPNVCITYPDHIATYKTGKNVVVSLEQLAADPKVQQAYLGG